MKYVNLGHSGLKVSRICLGCMGFGTPGIGQQKWAVDEEQAEKVITYALSKGINFFDTANMYSQGESERIVGKILNKHACRDDIVVATKIYYPMYQGVNAQGLSRKAIMREVDHSLKRLGMDYIDLLIIHRFDETTPVEETMEALHDLVKMGKVRYLGASSMSAWQFAKMQYVAKMNHWTPFISMQDMYNLLYREEEHEMIPLLQDMDVAMTPWSPLARGKLARSPETISARGQNDALISRYYQDRSDDLDIINRVGEIAQKRGVSRATIAMAWEFSKPYVTAPLIGSTKISHIDTAIEALSLHLTDEEVAYLEEPYHIHEWLTF